VDPLGGINSLWPLFGIANQLLATIALCVGTTVLIKMGKWEHVWVTLLPLCWLAIVTLTASAQKVFHPNPSIGFLSHARHLAKQLAEGKIPVARIAEAHRQIFNDRLDAVVTGVFASVVLLVLAEAGRQWWLYARRRRKPALHEAPIVVSRIAA
jgi:carbon starvation protein